jgi:hypothetical protein
MNICTVYWIRKGCDADILKEGYVGFTSRDPEIRKKEWAEKREGTFEVVAQGTEGEMLDLERELRPTAYIGDNISVGGFKGGGEHPRSQSTKEKIRYFNLNGTKDTETKKKISQTLTGKHRWITNGKDNALVLAVDTIPEGWYSGRSGLVAANKRKVVYKGKSYESLTEASRNLGIPMGTMHRIIKREE